MPDISAVVCTHNRCDLLRKTMQSLLDQTLDHDRYEIIVVDNASKDKTAATVKELVRQDGRVRYVLERELGLSYARNAGLAAARAGIVAYIDDDALADRRWLVALLRVYDAHPQVWAVGGRALPLWEVDRPDWLHDALLINLTVHDLGDRDRRLQWPEILVGTNCSFRRELFDRIGPFAVARGQNRYGDETELQLRMHQEGLGVYYAPDALVHHLVPASRLSKSYFWRRAYWQGNSNSVQKHLERGRRSTRGPGAGFGTGQLAKGIFWLLVRLGGFVCLYPVSSEGQRVKRLCMVWAARGRIRHEWAHLRHTCICWRTQTRDSGTNTSI